jgi:2-keto-3-deoxy-L-rhamnonate aldolase RhmA
MRQNNIKAKHGQGITAFGLAINLACPELVEIAGLLGFDYVRIDAEHGPMEVETCEQMVRAAEAVGVTPIIRMPYPDPLLINRYLDTGAMGVLCPHLNSRARAEAIVAGAKYHPMGHRGAGSGTRAADYGLRLSAPQYAEWANSETIVMGILEDKEAVDNLPEILQVEGLYALVIGPSDLSQSLGLPGQTTHPDVLRLIEKMNRMIMASGKLLSISLRGTATALEEAQRYVDMGVPILNITIKNILIRGAKDLLKIKKTEPVA